MAFKATLLVFSGFAMHMLHAAPCVAPPPGLVGWWPGDADARNIVGNDNPSSSSGVTEVSGKVANGFSFAPRSSITVPSSSTLANQTFTWVAWAKPAGPGATNDRNGSVIVNQVNTGTNFVQISWSSATAQFVFVFGDNPTDFIISHDTFPAGSFYLVAGSYDGSVFRLYVNGVLEGSLARTKTIAYTSAGWQFGGNLPSEVNIRTWNGVIDEIQAFNRALSPSELVALFNAADAGVCKTPGIGTVISASGFGGFPTIAPGSYLEIYGSILATNARQWEARDFTGINAPTSLDGTSVTVGGQDAFIYYVSPSQINILVPSTIPLGLQPIIVKTAYGSASFTATANALQPGLLSPPSFTIGGVPFAVAVFGDGAFVLPTGALSGITSRPAKPGSVIVLYGIGFGPVTPYVPAGQLAQQATSLMSNFQVTIGGMPARVDYAGLAPSFTGLYQFNIAVPNLAPGNWPLTFTLGGSAGAQSLNIPVAN